MEQLTFTVPTNGLCVMCLTDSSRTEQVSVGSIHSYLDLDYRKIFSITAPKIVKKEETEVEKDLVDIKVTMCRSCSEVRNRFCGLYEEMEALQRNITSCLETMLEVMVNAESKVIRNRRYQQKVARGGGGEQGRGATAALSSAPELVKASIPDKFRKETMFKCISEVKKATVKKEVTQASRAKKEPATAAIEEELEFESSDNLSDEDEAMKVDEDADPEELMIRYNSCPEKYQPTADPPPVTSKFYSAEGSIWDDEETLEFEEQTESGADNKTTFNSKYKCKICSKVVVSLKNFELHQRRHTGEKPFACPFCEQHFRDTSNLRSHTLRYHRQFLFANFKDATLSDDQFKIGLDKIVQSIVQVSEGSGLSHQCHQCYLCNKDYTQKYAIEDHIVQRHYDVLSTAILHLQKEIHSYESQDIAQYMAQIMESGETCTICGLCGQQFNSGVEVNNHMKVHVKVKVARSQGSVQKSDTSDSLIQLKMKCNFCSKYFEDLHALTMHKTLHQGNCASAASRESIYNCEHCGRSFCSYYSQRSHVLSFHRYQVFSKYLPAGTTAAEIETVVKGITGKYTKLPNGLFQCSLCSKEITQLRKLQSHMLVTHFDEVVIKLKVAIHQFRFKSGKGVSGDGDAEPPELDHYEDSNGSLGGTFEEDYFDEDNLAMVSLNEDEDASENLEVLISYPE